MTQSEFDELLRFGAEQRNVEFKGPGRASDRGFLARIARACLGMANLRGGGVVIIGVSDVKGQPPNPVGLTPEQLESWRPRDDNHHAINSYAEPSVSLTFSFDPSCYRCVIIRVSEFTDVPVVCRKTFRDAPELGGQEGARLGREVLRAGAYYNRPRRKVETAEVGSYEDMRELLDLAIEKGVQRMVRLGITAHQVQGPNDRTRFNEELGDL